ncbi:MAG: tRNA (N6-threonylcarbamoyladenosine(37)-N6)-methyltransferase TrmO [Melioribacteraceae bacterium]|nr:MAG: tRNA (N6-threonylcarbamoyladenosine(37)-N6)-methyltransferase TrmO [Melioribacteraceae bacterium]
MNESEIIIKPIGVIRSEFKLRYETPRQGILAGENKSVIELYPKHNFQQALKGLEGFDRIWVLYQFHLNNNWKPQVNPPRHTRKKIGVFASRAPYRPNQIGMSCVKLEKIYGLKIYISGSDILDGSPVIDIKPYLPYSDSFPDSSTGWVKNGLENIYEIVFEDAAVEHCKWLKENANINLKSFAKLQLEFNPADDSRKRIEIINKDKNSFVLAYRTWRIFYSIIEKEKKVIIEKINTGYSKEELKNLKEDKYADKKLANLFVNKFAM